jgi:hypothetical protein
MLSLLVFNRVYILEIQTFMLVFSTPLVKYCLSNLLIGSPPYVNIQCVTGGRIGCVESIYRIYTLCF